MVGECSTQGASPKREGLASTLGNEYHPESRIKLGSNWNLRLHAPTPGHGHTTLAVLMSPHREKNMALPIPSFRGPCE